MADEVVLLPDGSEQVAASIVELANLLERGGMLSEADLYGWVDASGARHYGYIPEPGVNYALAFPPEHAAEALAFERVCRHLAAHGYPLDIETGRTDAELTIRVQRSAS